MARKQAESSVASSKDDARSDEAIANIARSLARRDYRFTAILQGEGLDGTALRNQNWIEPVRASVTNVEACLCPFA